MLKMECAKKILTIQDYGYYFLIFEENVSPPADGLGEAEDVSGAELYPDFLAKASLSLELEICIVAGAGYVLDGIELRFFKF